MSETRNASIEVSLLLPVCAWCEKVRDSAGDWKDSALSADELSVVALTHGICPECQDAHLNERSC